MNEKWTEEKVRPESRSVSLFSDSDANYLRCFANDMKMEPLVAHFIVFQRSDKKYCNNSAYLFLTGLNDLEDMRNDKTVDYVISYEKKVKDKETKEEKIIDTGFRLKFGGTNESILNELCNDSRITWFKLEIDDHHIADTYNINRKNTNEHLKNEHWDIQQGTFGEYLALWSFGKNHKMRGFRVDSSGADLVLVDADNPSNTNEHYAVSVKTFTYQNKTQYQFENKFENSLMDYIDRWTLCNDEQMKPMVCFNCVRYDQNDYISKVYMIAFDISNIDRKTETQPIYRTDGGITIKYDDVSLEKIKKEPSIIFNEIDFTNHNFKFD